MALDGVGPSMACGSHPENGTCALFPIAAKTSKSDTIVAVAAGTRQVPCGQFSLKSRSKSPDPTARCTITAAASRPTSQTR